MSRFFRAAGDSSSESSDEEELYSEEEEEDAVPKADSDEDEESDEDEDASSSDSDEGRTGADRFLKGADSSDSDDSDDEVRKKVRSAKDKRHEELEATIKHIENAQKIDDWGSIAAGTKPQLSSTRVSFPQSSM